VNYMFRKLSVILLVLLLSACGTSPKTNFYLLSSDNDIESNTSEDISIGLWQINLPELIDRPEIVTRTGPYTIDMADFHRWAGDLENNVSILIAEELSHNLNTGYVTISPWPSYRNLDYQIKVLIREFTGELGGESKLEGAYIILNGKGNKKILDENFALKEKTKGGNYSDMVSAMSRLVIHLSAQISAAISVQIKNKSEQSQTGHN